jgi:cytidine deaminase
VNVTINWTEIIKASQEVMENAYCPYSNYKVGAAGLLEDGRIVTGCNVENMSFGLTTCAENGMISENVKGGRELFVAISIVKSDGSPTPPCGRCRQVMAEHSNEATLIMTPEGPKGLLATFLPWPFFYDPENR